MERHITAKIGTLTLSVMLLFGFALPTASYAAMGPGPLVSHFSIDRMGSVDRSTGEGTVYGSVTCREQVDMTVTVNLRQPTDSPEEEPNLASTSFSCNGVTAWSVEVSKSNGTFKPGRARADAKVEWTDPNPDFGSSQDELYRIITLRAAR